MERKEREAQNTTQSAFECLLEELAELRVYKIDKYGESRYYEPPQENMMLCWSDIHRKYIRVKNLALRFSKIAPHCWADDEIKALRDAYMDIASYGLMGAQILDKEIQA